MIDTEHMESDDWENPDADHEAESRNPYDVAEMVIQSRNQFNEMLTTKVKGATALAEEGNGGSIDEGIVDDKRGKDEEDFP